MKIAAVILANTKEKKWYNLTRETLDSLRKSDDWTGSIYIVETQSKQYLKDNNFSYGTGVNVIHPNCEFNYNKFLNIGIAACVSNDVDWYLICNNDILFSKDWLVNTREAYKLFPDISSFSFYEPSYHGINPHEERCMKVGYSLSHVCGWCILTSKQCVEDCNLFDERFPMYYQDNDYAFSIHAKGYKHVLLYDVKVEHHHEQSKSMIREEFLHTGKYEKILQDKFPDMIPNRCFLRGEHLRVSEDIYY